MFFASVLSKSLKNSQLPYPWNNDISNEDYNLKLINLFQNSPYIFQMPEDILPKALNDTTLNPELGQIYFTESNNVEYTASVLNLTNIMKESIQIEDNMTAETYLKLLKNLCLLHYPQDEYWSFEWCHRTEIRQFHLEHLPPPNPPGRSPDFSLGIYKNSLTVRTGGDTQNLSAPIIKIIDFYNDGQYCDETKLGRSTQVHFQCCETNLPTSTQKKKKSLNLPVEGHKIEILSMKETAICAYEMTICADFMCPKKKTSLETSEETFQKLESNSDSEKESTGIVPVKKQLDLVKFMSHISNTCMYRQEGSILFSYICFFI